MVIIFVLSAQPKLPSPPNSLLNLLLKKGAHMLEYAILMLLWWRALAGGDKKSARPNTGPDAIGDKRSAQPYIWLGLAWLLTILYAASDEFHQTFVPGRNGTPWDVLIDSLGASISAVIIGWWIGRKRLPF